MNRYKSRKRWRRVDDGVYCSPCGNFKALREGYSRWTLVAGDKHLTYGPFVALADCQDYVARLEAPLGTFR